MSLGKFIILVLFAREISTQVSEKYTIGVVGKKWFDILSKRFIERKYENNAILKLLTVNFSIPFYEDLTTNFKQIVKFRINLIIGDSSMAMAQTAAHLQIPYISVDPYICQSNPAGVSNMQHFYSLALPDKSYSIATLDILYNFQVQAVSVIIDSSVDYDSFSRPLLDQKTISVRIWTISDEISQDIRKIPKQLDQILEESRLAGIWDFVVKARPALVKAMILRAKYYGMLVQPNKWYLPSFLCYDINIAAIRQIYSNITLINEQCSESMLRYNNNYSDIAIMNKALQIFRKVNWELTPVKLNNALKQSEPRIYNGNGLQKEFRFTLYSINVDDNIFGNLRLVGVWMFNRNSSSLNYFYEKNKVDDLRPSSNYHIRVSAIEEHPHLIVLENGSEVGFGVDMLSELGKLMNFTYKIYLTDSIGSKEQSNWTGIVGEIQSGRADMSLGPLVQTQEIEEVIDFSASFKQREISLVIKKPSPSTNLFQFFSPFSTNVWLCCIAALLLVTLAMWSLEHFHNLYFPTNELFPINLKESSWVAIACVLKQQMDIFPSSIPGRIIHYLIIFFSLIIITSYTANLAAFLTIKVYPNPVNTVEDLANLPENSKITFGTVNYSPILEFFEQSEMETFKKIYASMKNNPHWLVNDSKNGYRRALTEPYVFIWDDSVNQYEISTEPSYNCNLTTVGRPFGQRSFAIGMKSGSELMKQLNLNILHLIESGKCGNLEKKWWESRSICTAKELPVETPLSLEEVAGVFLIVVMGVVVSAGWLLCQIIVFKLEKCKARKIQKDYLKNEPLNHDQSIDPLKNDRNGKRTF